MPVFEAIWHDSASSPNSAVLEIKQKLIAFDYNVADSRTRKGARFSHA
jgi:hypothetical protein